MKTRTILSAYAKTIAALASDPTVPRKWYQRQAFERELLRRMDERDEMVAPRQVFLTPERIGQYMASLSDDIKADDILRGGK